MSMDLSFGGADELLAALDDLEGPVAEEAMRLGVKAGSKVIQGAMSEAAPVLDSRTAKSTALPPGALKEDIRVSALKRDGVGFVYDEIGPGARTQHVALWVEYGHRDVKGGYSKVLADGRTRGRGHEVGQVPAHPFLRRAFEASAKAALDEAATVALEAIRKGAK